MNERREKSTAFSDAKTSTNSFSHSFVQEETPQNIYILRSWETTKVFCTAKTMVIYLSSLEIYLIQVHLGGKHDIAEDPSHLPTSS